jgi:nitrogen fixation/metabolism regulation signal transduction histidine kinase
MRRLSIARSLCLALVGLTLALATIAVLGISSLYSARQRYENILVDSSTLATDAANLEAATLAEQEVLRDARGGFSTAGASAGALASVRTLAAEIEARQQLRESAARSQARSDSRRAIVLIALAGLLALAGALGLILALVRGMSRPLDELVHATRGLAIGELERRVKPSGPRELQELGAAFNVMGEDLTGARRRIPAAC